MSGDPGDFDTYVTGKHHRLNITAFIKTSSTAVAEDIIAKADAYARKNFPSDIKMSPSGSLANITALNRVLVDGKLRNIAQILMIVFVLACLVFGSFWGGALTAMPIALTVAANFGIMGMLNIHLDIATSIVSALAVGIGADYAIYFISRLKEELTRIASERTGLDRDALWKEAMRRTLVTTGKGIFFVSSAVALGYLVLCLSPFKAHFMMGLLVTTGMIISSSASVALLPVVATLIKPKFLSRCLDAPKFGGSMPKAPASAAAIGIVLLSGGLLSSTPARAEGLTAAQIMEKNYVTGRLKQSHMASTMELIDKKGEKRVRKNKSISLLKPNGSDNRSIVVFEAPADIKGTSVYIDEDQGGDKVWVYLPALKKNRRLPGSGKRESFVGSDFNYGDLILPRVSEFNYKMAGEQPCPDDKSIKCYIIEGTPANAGVLEERGVSFKKSWIRSDNFVSVRFESKDEKGRPWKEFQARNVKLIDPVLKRYLPLEVEIRDLQNEHSTRIIVDRIDAQLPVSEDLLKPSQLERGINF